MDAYRCDGCKKVSPDEDGMHIANHWSIVSVTTIRNSWKSTYHLCTDCLPTNNSPYGIVKSIVNFLKR